MRHWSRIFGVVDNAQNQQIDPLRIYSAMGPRQMQMSQQTKLLATAKFYLLKMAFLISGLRVKLVKRYFWDVFNQNEQQPKTNGMP